MEKKLKIFHLHFGRDGGAERFFVHLVNALAERGVEQKSVIRPHRIWRSLIEGQTDIIESHFRNLSLDRVLLPSKLRHIVNSWAPDAMIAWTPKACRLMPASFNGHKIVRLGDYPHSLNRFQSMDTIVANTPDIIQRMKNLGWNKSTKVISNFTSNKKAAPIKRSELGVPENVRLISSMGRFVHRKGFDTLIRAVQKNPDNHLLLVGDGEERQALLSLAKSLNFENRLHLTGWQNDTRPFLRASDILVLPSRHEPLGNVILEAWAQGIPVISTRSEGPIWFMEDGVNGLLTDINDVEGLSTAIGRLNEEPHLASKLISGGGKTLNEQFSEEVITKAYIELFSNPL